MFHIKPCSFQLLWQSIPNCIDSHSKNRNKNSDQDKIEFHLCVEYQMSVWEGSCRPTFPLTYNGYSGARALSGFLDWYFMNALTVHLSGCSSFGKILGLNSLAPMKLFLFRFSCIPRTNCNTLSTIPSSCFSHPFTQLQVGVDSIFSDWSEHNIRISHLIRFCPGSCSKT